MTVLVTGATGFIGRHLLRRLAGRHDVVAIARRSVPAELSGLARWIQLDLASPLDRAVLPGRAETVVHLAQSARYREFPNAAADVFAVNVQAPAALLDYARAVGADRFVLCSTGGVYGHRDGPIREADPVAPIGFYQASKYAAEVLLAPYREFLRTAVLRPFFVYGPGQRRALVAGLGTRVLHGEKVTVEGDPGLRINPVHVDDAARAIEATLSLEASDIVNLAGDEVVTMTELVRGLAAAAGTEPRISYDAAGPAGDLLGDNTRMKTLLGVTPAVRLDVGLAEVVDELRRSEPHRTHPGAPPRSP